MFFLQILLNALSDWGRAILIEILGRRVEAFFADIVRRLRRRLRAFLPTLRNRRTPPS
jgi:hypothetical protein